MSVGSRQRPTDWAEQTDGSFAYTADLAFPGLLHASILRSPHPHAQILEIDKTAALAMPGVRAIVTAEDFPGHRYLHEGAADRAPMAEDIVRFVGQEVAAVAAETPEQARAACAAIRVRYRPLAAPLTLDEALAPAAGRLHRRPTLLRNRSVLYHRRWGKHRAGVAASSVHAEGRFDFPAQHHACMEPGVAVARWSAEDERLELWSPTGAPYYVQREVAHVLGLDPTQVACREIGVGGSFGARTKVADHEAITARLAMATGAPVRLSLSREEEFATTKSRHAFRIRLGAHADAGGRLRAIDGHVEVENGAYNHSGASVMSAALKGLGMLYQPDGLDVSAELIDTAQRPGGQFRGYGTTQSSFALEMLVDELAGKAGIDPLAWRIANANPSGSVTLVGARIGTSGLARCLAAAGDAIGWTGLKRNRPAGEGVGIASAVHVSGSHVHGPSNRSDCALDLSRAGRVRVRFGGSDAGTGQKTILAQIVATELGIPIDHVRVQMMDSDATPFDMGAWSSRGTHYSGHAARLAATTMRARLATVAAARLGGGEVHFADGIAHGVAGAVPIAELLDGCEGADAEGLTVESSYVEQAVEVADADGVGNISPSYNFAAHAARVHVCTRTGRLRILDYVAAHDVGTAINPTFVEGQVIGGAAMGIGIALGEEVVTEQGRVVNGNYVNYALPRAGDLPRIRAILVPGHDPAGPFGAKGVGETGVNPPPAAIANAIYDAIGIRLTAPPFTPDKIMEALRAARGERGRQTAVWRRPGRWWIALVRQAYALGLFRLLHARMLRDRVEEVPVPVEAITRPTTLAALTGAAVDGAAPLGGGIDLHLRRRQGLAAAPRLTSVNRVPDLHGIVTDDHGWRIGAGNTLVTLRNMLGEALPALAEAIDTIASPQVRAVATLGGNLLQANRCWFLRNGFDCFKRRGGMAPCYAILGDHRFYHAAVDGHRCQAVTPSDLATVFTALDAVAVLADPSGIERRVPVADLYVGPGETVLAAGEILVALIVPRPTDGTVMAFEKLRLWEGDFAVASAMLMARTAADDQGMQDVRIVLGGIAPVPLRLRDAEAGVSGGRIEGEAFAAAVTVALDAVAHPLARNAWKLDAVAGLAAQAGDRLASSVTSA